MLEGPIEYFRGRGFVVARRLAQRRALTHMRRHDELWTALDAYQRETDSTGCGISDYHRLYEAIRRRRPREVLECGTGVSTLVIAHALRENERETGLGGRVTSMEESEEWMASAVGLLPDRYRPQVDFVLSDTVEDTFSIFRGVRYRDTPDRPYEFVFVDGPSYRSPVDGTPTFDFDFIHVLRNTTGVVAGLVDQRVSTCFVLQQILGPRKVRYSPVLGLGMIGPCSAADLGRLDVELSSANFYGSFALARRTRLMMNRLGEEPR